MHESYLKHRQYLYLKAAAAFLAVSILAYIFLSPPTGGNGGTWVGYTLGTISALAIIWLMWFGIRKRSYSAKGMMLREWLSAHVYLGLALLLLVPLHSGFQFGMNVHTLAYALMCIVIVSGIVGVRFYADVPTEITENREGEKLSLLIEQLATMDAECKSAASGLPDALARAVLRSTDETRIGGSIRQQLFRKDPATRQALATVRTESHDVSPADREKAKQIVGLLAAKQQLLDRIELDVRHRALLNLWLIFHVPMAFATIATVAAHVVIVFYYR